MTINKIKTKDAEREEKAKIDKKRFKSFRKKSTTQNFIVKVLIIAIFIGSVLRF